jgi:hypothetical protein
MFKRAQPIQIEAGITTANTTKPKKPRLSEADYLRTFDLFDRTPNPALDATYYKGLGTRLPRIQGLGTLIDEPKIFYDDGSLRLPFEWIRYHRGVLIASYDRVMHLDIKWRAYSTEFDKWKYQGVMFKEGPSTFHMKYKDVIAFINHLIDLGNEKGLHGKKVAGILFTQSMVYLDMIPPQPN